MKFNRRCQRIMTAFLLTILLNEALTPSIAFALTSGPTAPEATSFEPVDTTDMVNPLTGDFTYNLPLLEVPGPEGGYPLSLSYHAGIQPDEEASWVGLGWTLNPGAITRNVNGYPDDWQGVNAVNRSYWNGGSTKTIGLDVGVGLGPANVSFGLAFSKDTYRGFGVGASLGISGGFGLNDSPFGLGGGATIGISPYGDVYGGINIGLTSGEALGKSMRLSGITGISTNFSNVSAFASGGVSYSDNTKEKSKQQQSSDDKNFQPSLLGASISSSGGKGRLTVGGGSVNVFNSNANRIQTEGGGWGFTIPIPGVSIGVSYNYMRYWTDETYSVSTNGVLYNHASINASSDMNTVADDNYFLLDPKNTDVFINSDAERQTGGTFPNFDDYSVTAQGLSGNIRPYVFQSILFTQNHNPTDGNGKIINEKRLLQEIGTSNKTISSQAQFRFINDFSNSYRQTSNYVAGGFNFGQSYYGNQDGEAGYDATSNRLEGSKHIEYFTNTEINDLSPDSKAHRSGFIDCKAAGFERAGGSMIGGFMITNASGVTYHYALPAYTGNETVYQKKVDETKGKYDNTLKKNATYAYTWYLTAITGQDYVDRGTPGLDNSDWGYWIAFDYGKWAAQYAWRNPLDGAHKDIDGNFETSSWGDKEVYYLNAIRTRTHTAVFVKEIRADSKAAGSYIAGNSNLRFADMPAGALKLKNIYLFQNDQILNTVDQIRTSGSSYNHFGRASGHPIHFGNNIIDVDDIVNLSESLDQKCLRKIDFSYNYSLCPQTPNSFDPAGENYTQSSAFENPLTFDKQGKLTLLAVNFLGKGGVESMPPVYFDYDLDVTNSNNKDNIDITSVPADLHGTVKATTAGKLALGDILTFNIDNITYYCTLISSTDGQSFNVQYLNQAPKAKATNIAAVKTKNPPYNNKAIDMWGSYKSDYIDYGNENLSKLTTENSNKSVDVWSLRRITSSLGSQIVIDYEGDAYSKAAIPLNATFPATMYLADNNDLSVGFSGPQIPNHFLLTGQQVNVLVFKTDTHFGNYDGDGSEGFDYTYNTISSDDYSEKPVIKQSSPNQNGISIKIGTAMANEIRKKKKSESMIWVQGNVSFGYSNTDKYGGGIRVKSIMIDDLAGNKQKTNYNYNMPSGNSQSISSGTTSYEPYIFSQDQIPDDGKDPYVAETAIPQYRSRLYRNLNYLLSIARELPAPGVMYANVFVQDSKILPDGQEVMAEGKTCYQYEVLNANMIGIKEYGKEMPSADGYTERWDVLDYKVGILNSYRRNLVIKDYTSRVGNLKRVITYDKLGNKLTETINNYLHDGVKDQPFDTQIQSYEPALDAFNNIGVVQESYGNMRLVGRKENGQESGHTIYAFDEEQVMSTRAVYPAIQTGSTQIDYKNGTKVEQKNLAFDFYSGSVIKSLVKDSYGNLSMNEVTPAYVQYPAMGLKTHDDAANATSSHRHMLTQIASNYSYSVNESLQKTGLINATVQTWDNTVPVIDHNGVITTDRQSNIWRMRDSYMWKASGQANGNVTPIASFKPFYADGGSANASWKKTVGITLYNVFSNALEARDLNSNYAATRMGYNDSKVLISGTMAHYKELAYTGAEDELKSNSSFSGGITKGDGTINTDTTNVHTGIKSLKVSAGQSGFSYTIPSADVRQRDYIISTWVKAGTAEAVKGSLYYQIGNNATVYPNLNYNRVAAGWYLLQAIIPAAQINSGNAIIVGCKNVALSGDIYFDDFRVQPRTSGATAYVYDNQTGELTYVLNNNNIFTRYQYDAAGRLVRTYKEVLAKNTVPIVAAVNYNYGATKKFFSKLASQAFTLTTCTTNYVSPFYKYVVYEGKYTGATQAAADAKAQADLQANGPVLASQNLTCIPSTATLYVKNNTGIRISFVPRPQESVTVYYLDPGASKSITMPVGNYTLNIGGNGQNILHFTVGSRTQTGTNAVFQNVLIYQNSDDLVAIANY